MVNTTSKTCQKKKASEVTTPEITTEVIMREEPFTLELRISGITAGYYIRMGDDHKKAVKLSESYCLLVSEAEDEFKKFVRIASGLGIVPA